MDWVPAPSAILSMELPAQSKPQQGKRSAALEGSGVTGAGSRCWPHPFACPHMRNTASQPPLGFILCGGDGRGGLWTSLLALVSGQAQILPPPTYILTLAWQPKHGALSPLWGLFLSK